jgi:hypothetical protein
VAMNYSPIEVKVREATNPDEPWGPHGTLMAEIAQATYSYDSYSEAMDMVWRRVLLDVEPKAWRRIYKVHNNLLVSCRVLSYHVLSCLVLSFVNQCGEKIIFHIFIF